MTTPSPPDAASYPDAAAGSIVGRTREQAILRERLGAVLGGRGSLVLIGGQAGIGKTTLVDWLAGEARRQQALVLNGHCYDLTLTPPYGPWLDAFAALPDPGGTALQPLQPGTDLSSIPNQTALFDQVRAFLAHLTARAPTVLVFEDLHWSDPASLELLRHLARGVAMLRLLLIATYRDDELPRQHPVFQLLPLLARESQAERIELPALTDASVQDLIGRRYSLTPADRDRLVAFLQGRAEGNPFYLTELLRTLEAERLLQQSDGRWQVGELDRAPVPPLIRQVSEGRLARLEEGTRRLLEIAAVIGQDVPLDVWQAASEADRDRLLQAVEQAIGANLMRMPMSVPGASVPPSPRFSHALVREALYHGLPLRQRGASHRRVAEILAERAEPPLSAIAAHFEQADDPRASDWLVRAGQRALALYAARDAVADLSRARMLAERHGRDLPPEAYRARASAFAMLGEFDRARRDHELVLQRARTSGDRRAEWQALVDLAMLWAERDYERTGLYCRAALELARSAGDRRMLAHSLNQVANWHVNQDDPDAALPLHQDALALFEQLADLEGIASTLDLLGMTAYLRCDLAASTDYYERAIPLLQDLDDRQRLSSCLAVIALNGGDLDCMVLPVYREARYWIGSGEEGLALARAIDWPAGEAMARFALSMALGVRGELGRALEHGEAARRIAEAIGHQEWAVAAGYALGRVKLELLDLADAVAELERALARARLSGSRFWIKTATGVLASALIAAGNPGQAAALLGTIAPPDQPRPRASIAQYQYWYSSAELALATGAPDQALGIVDQLIDAATGSRPDQAAPQLATLRAGVLAGLGRLDDAEQTYRAARDRAALFGFQPLCWRIDAALCALYQTTGRPDQAAAAARRAWETVEALSAAIEDEAIREPFRQRALDRLPAAPEAAQRPPASSGLSPREMDVLRLLAEGKSDREIAMTLFISPRTVMRHVANILAKLDVPSRTAAATLAVRQKLV